MPECGCSLRCQRTHLIAPLTNTAVLSEQDAVGLRMEMNEKRGSNRWQTQAAVLSSCLITAVASAADVPLAKFCSCHESVSPAQLLGHFRLQSACTTCVLLCLCRFKFSTIFPTEGR